MNPSFIKAHRFDFLIALFFLILAGFLYFYRIEQITPGMFADEIYVAKMSENLLKLKHFTPFVTENFGHPTPQLYLIGWILNSFGRSITNIRFISVLFGIGNCILFYFFLRLFFDKKISFFGNLLFLSSYVHIIISRFAYEMTAGIFFEIAFLISFFLYIKKKSFINLFLISLSLGIGLYTYLGFRIFALTAFLISLFCILKNQFSIKSKFLHTIIFVVSLLIILFPLINYSFKNPENLWLRAKSVSIFHQNYSSGEFKKELWGSVSRTLGMFLFVGDPNPRQNPAQTIPFDLITVGLFIIGLIYVFFKKRSWFFFIILLTASSLANDIFSVERIPEFHYYGLGHPNTLRITGILPFIYLGSAFGLKTIKTFIKKQKILFFSIITIIIFALNINRYFNQPYLPFNYEANGVFMLQISKYFNHNFIANTYVSSSIYSDPRVQYFVKDFSKIKEIFLKKNPCSSKDIPEDGNQIIFYVKDSPQCTNEILKELSDKKYFIQAIKNPWGSIDAIILKKLTY